MKIFFLIFCICQPSYYEDSKHLQTSDVPIQQSGDNERSAMIAGEEMIPSPVSSKCAGPRIVNFGHVCLLYPTTLSGIKIVQVDYEFNYNFRFFLVMFT